MFLEFIRAIVVKRLLFFMFILCYSKIIHHICSAQQFYTYNTVRLDKLAFFAGVFMSAYLVVPLKYWYPCTPVWSVNVPTD